MQTCPYYWSGRIEGAMCRNGCWEEPECHTGGPFKFLPDWPAERCLAKAVDRHVHERPPGGADLDLSEMLSKVAPTRED